MGLNGDLDSKFRSYDRCNLAYQSPSLAFDKSNFNPLIMIRK